MNILSGCCEATQPTLKTMDDDALMILAQKGALEAFDIIVRRYQTRVLQTARKCLGRNDLAAEVAQDCFVELYRAIPRYRAEGKFQPYLFRILLYRCRMALRTIYKEKKVRQISLSLIGAPQRPITPSIIRNEQLRDLDRALLKLSKKLREVVVLRFGPGLSHSEIASILEIPEGTAKRRLFEGLKKLRQIMETYKRDG